MNTPLDHATLVDTYGILQIWSMEQEEQQFGLLKKDHDALLELCREHPMCNAIKAEQGSIVTAM